MVGGTVADLFRAQDRGSAMNVFSIMIFTGQVSLFAVTVISSPIALGIGRTGNRLDRDVLRYTMVLWSQSNLSFVEHG